YTRCHLPLNRRAPLPVAGPDTPAVEQRGILRGVEDRFAEVGVGDGGAEVAAARAEILRGVVRQVAVGSEVAVPVGPGARRRRRDSGGGTAGDEEAAVLRRLEVAADVEFQRRLAVAEQINRHAAARRQVFVRIDALGLVE